MLCGHLQPWPCVHSKLADATQLSRPYTHREAGVGVLGLKLHVVVPAAGNDDHSLFQTVEIRVLAQYVQ